MTTAMKRVIGQTNACVQQERREVAWLWDGVLAIGAVTLLSAPEKIGKTTLLSLLLDRLHLGGNLLGRTVWPGKAIVCSEENRALWALRQPPLDFGPDLLFHQPSGSCPTRADWERFIDDVITLCFVEGAYDLLVIDTAMRFLPLSDRNKGTLRWALSTLQEVTRLPLAVLVVNQSRNMHRPLAATADIVLDMSIPRRHEGTRRRTFTGVGRYPGTLRSVTADLNPAGTDYVPAEGDAATSPLLSQLQSLLTASPAPLTCSELLEHWPGPPPRPDSLWRVLARGVELGLFRGEGKGTKTEPFRFGAVTPPTTPTSCQQVTNKVQRTP